MKKYVLLLSILVIFFGCEKDPTVELVPTITTGTSLNISYTSAAVSFSIDNNHAVVESGILWDTKRTFDNSSHYVGGSNGVGSHTVDLNSLSSGSTIYYKAYAKDGRGNYIYGEVKSFITKNIILPIITTSDISDITGSSAICGGVINLGSLAITNRGVCWNTYENPTVNSNKIYNGTGSGVFTSTITGLTANTKYYVRAFAKDAANNVVYGNEKSFTTINSPVVIVTTGYGYNLGYNSSYSSYPYRYTISASIVGLSEISSWGVMVSGNSDFSSYASYLNPTTGYTEGTFYTSSWGATGPSSWYFRAYAVCKTGEKIYGVTKTITLK